MPAAASNPGNPGGGNLGGARPIAGVGTSTAAFVGWADKGPTNIAVLVESWTDFQAQFGGLSGSNGVPNYLGYSVSQFFGNGGQQAYIVRIAWDGSLAWAGAPSPSQPARAASATGIGGAFTLYASSPGAWGNNLAVKVLPEPSPSTSFTVRVLDGSGNLLEDFASLSVSPASARYVVTVIDEESQNVTYSNPALPPNAVLPAPVQPGPTPAAGVQLAGGLDGPVLVPGDVNFETALGARGAAIGDNAYGVGLLNRVGIFSILCVPGEADEATIRNLQKYCVGKRVFYLVDSPRAVTRDALFRGELGTVPSGGPQRSLTGRDSRNSAYYYPWVVAPDPLAGDSPALFPPSGFLAGIYACNDLNRGVWTAPAGIAASLAGATGLHDSLTDMETVDLSADGINCLRQFAAYGIVPWGARTLAGSDQDSSQRKYIQVRRLAIFIESSLIGGLQWVAFEPNDQPLWGQIALSVSSFMQSLFQQGSFQGIEPSEAYFVTCDSENNPQSSIDLGVVNILVGFAPVFPAEFVLIQIQLLAG